MLGGGGGGGLAQYSVHGGVYVSKTTSKSLNMTEVSFYVLLFIIKWRTYYSKCVPNAAWFQISQGNIYLIDKMMILSLLLSAHIHCFLQFVASIIKIKNSKGKGFPSLIAVGAVRVRVPLYLGQS